MADDPTTPSDPAETADQATEKPPQPEIPAEVKAALRKANKEAESLRLKLKEFEDKDKTELQRLEERATNAEKAAAERESASLRYRVALTKGLPIELAERLRGNTEDELVADAEALMALIPQTPATRGALDQGARQGERTGSSINDLLHAAIKGR